MNQRAYSILFCALLASTFVHEIRAKSAARPSFVPKALERAVDQPLTCEVVCGGGSNGTISLGLSIQVNIAAQLFAVVNVTGNVALIVDINANLVVVLNGNTGSAVVINIDKSTGVYIKGGVWVGTDFTTYLQSLTGGLSALLNISGAVSFQVSSASSAILDVINQIMVLLIVDFASSVKNDAKVGINLIITIATAKIALFKGALKGLLEIIGAAGLAIKVDLAGLLNKIQGIAVFVGSISGGLAALIKAGVILNLAIILNAASGLEALINLILTIGTNIQLGGSLVAILNDVEGLFTIIALFGGNLNIGLTGLYKVLAAVVAFVKGKLQFEVLVVIVIQFLVANSNTDLNEAFNGTLTVLLEAIEKAGATTILAGLVVTVKALLAGTLVVNGVNISAIAKILISGVARGAGASLQVLVSAVLELKAYGDNGLALLYLFLVLIFQINTYIGLQLLAGLGVAIDVTIGAVSGSIISFLLQSVTNLIRLLLGDFYGALSTLPVIGKILIALNAAIKVSTNGQFDLQALLTASTLIKNLIKGLFQLLTGLQLFVSSAIVSQVEGMMKACTSYSVYYSVNATISISGSASASY